MGHQGPPAACLVGVRNSARYFRLVRIAGRIEIFAVTAATEFLPILAAAEAERKSVIVSLHDVAPSTRSVCADILRELKDAGVRTTSLLVVPDHHRKERAMADAGFVSWLRELEADGHEIVLHGYFHERPDDGRDDWSRQIVTRFYTDGEGEFFDLSYEEAFARITRAQEEFKAAKLAPVGFIAPAWLLNAQGERAARDAGMQYTTRLGKVIDLQTGRHQFARSLVYSTRASWRRVASLATNAALARVTAPALLVRLSIHPPDRRWPAVWKQVMIMARRLATNRAVTTYRDWIVEQRSVAP